MSIVSVVAILIAAVAVLGAFPGSAAALVDAVADGVRNWLAAAAAGLQSSMHRHDPPSPAVEARNPTAPADEAPRPSVPAGEVVRPSVPAGEVLPPSVPAGEVLPPSVPAGEVLPPSVPDQTTLLPTVQADEAPRSLARLMIGAVAMTIAFAPLLVAEGYLLNIGLTGLLGLEFSQPENTTVKIAGATGLLLSIKNMLAFFDAIGSIELAVSASVLVTLLVTAAWTFDERHLVRPRSERSLRLLNWLSRSASAAAIITILAASLHRGTASFETDAIPGVVSEAPISNPVLDGARSVDAYLGSDNPSSSVRASSATSAMPWFRPMLVVVGTIASALAPTLAVSIALVTGPLALAGLLWSIVLLVAAGVLIALARLVGIVADAMRRVLLLLIDGSASLMLPVVIASRTIHDRERTDLKAELPCSIGKLALTSWVLLVETERLVQLRQPQNNNEEPQSLDGATERRLPLGRAEPLGSVRPEGQNLPLGADDLATIDEVNAGGERSENDDAAAERVFHAYA